MENVEKAKQLLPPYVSYKTFSSFIEGLKVGVPNRVDRSVMATYSGAVQAQLFLALKFLGLISQQGIPTDKLHKLVESQGPEKKKVLKEMIASAYHFLFVEGFVLGKATGHEILERFTKTGLTGDTTRKSISFFMAAAKDAEIVLSPHAKATGEKMRHSLPRKKTKIEKVAPAELPNENGPDFRPPIGTTWQDALLSKFPTFDPSWPDEIKAKWFDGFKDLMDQGKKLGNP